MRVMIFIRPTEMGPAETADDIADVGQRHELPARNLAWWPWCARRIEKVRSVVGRGLLLDVALLHGVARPRRRRCRRRQLGGRGDPLRRWGLHGGAPGPARRRRHPVPRAPAPRGTRRRRTDRSPLRGRAAA